MTIRVRDRHYASPQGNVPFAIRTKVRKATGGIPFEQFMASDDRIGLPTRSWCSCGSPARRR